MIGVKNSSNEKGWIDKLSIALDTEEFLDWINKKGQIIGEPRFQKLIKLINQVYKINYAIYFQYSFSIFVIYKA